MTKRNQTYLHGFDGFYCSVFDPQLDDFDGEFEALFEGRVTKEQEKAIREEVQWNRFDYFDNDRYEEDVAKNWVEAFEEKVNELEGLEGLKFKFIAISSPKYYNYSTDKIEVEITGLNRKTLRAVAKLMKKHEDKLREQIEDDWKTRSGFWSFMNDSYDFWLKLFECDPNAWRELDKNGPYIYEYLVVMLYYLCDLENSDLSCELQEAALDGCWEWGYFDYDKLLTKLKLDEVIPKC